MISKFRVDTMGADGKWHCITSGLGMMPFYYNLLEEARTEAGIVSDSEGVRTRVVKIEETELGTFTPKYYSKKV